MNRFRLEQNMSDDKRTFEANTGLNQDLRLHARRVKGKKSPDELPPDGELNDLTDGNSTPISQELIMRLIKLLKET